MYFAVYFGSILFMQKQYSITDLKFKRPKLDVLCWHLLRIPTDSPSRDMEFERTLYMLNMATTYMAFLHIVKLFTVTSPSFLSTIQGHCKAKPSLYWQCWHVRGTVYVPCHYKTSPCITLQLKKLFYENDTKSSPCFFWPYWDRNRIPIVEAGGHRVFLLFTCSNHLNKGIQQDIWECLI